jgi:hypothetical protein
MHPVHERSEGVADLLTGTAPGDAEDRVWVHVRQVVFPRQVDTSGSFSAPVGGVRAAPDDRIAVIFRKSRAEVKISASARRTYDERRRAAPRTLGD